MESVEPFWVWMGVAVAGGEGAELGCRRESR